MNYYAFNALGISDTLALRDQLQEQMAADGSHATVSPPYWMALVDTAFDHGGPSLGWPGASVPLYNLGRLAVLADVSPVLYPLDHTHPQALSHELFRLLRHAQGRPMLSFLQASCSAKALAQQMQAVLEVQTSDGQNFLLRFADTRVSPALAVVLTREHWAQVTGCVSRWQVVNRAGLLEDLPLSGSAAVQENEALPLNINDAELNGLLQRGAPDALIQALHEKLPDLLPADEKATFYQQMAQVCQLAQTQQIESFPDLFALGAASCATNGRFLSDPRFTAWLEAHAWQAGQFEIALDGLLESFE